MKRFDVAMHDLRAAQKSSRGAPAYSRYINRPLGRPLAALAYQLALTPTQVTLLSGAATATGILLVALSPPSLGMSISISALLILGYALDSADGQLARLTGSGSLAGEWLDHFFDSLKAAALHLCVLISWFRWWDLDAGWYLVPLAYSFAASTFFFGVVMADVLRRVHRAINPPAASSAPAAVRTSALYSLAVTPLDYGFTCFVFLTFWVPWLFLPIYTALAAVNLLLLPLAALRWYRSIRALETSEAAS